MILSSYIGSGGNSTISGLGPRSVYKMIFYLASAANLCCSFHFTHRRDGSGVVLSQKASIPGEFVCLLTAPCRTLLVYSQLRVTLMHFKIIVEIPQAKYLLCF